MFSPYEFVFHATRPTLSIVSIAIALCPVRYAVAGSVPDIDLWYGISRFS